MERARVDDFKKVAAEYDQAHANVAVNVVGEINDEKIVAAIRAGNAPDIASSFNSYDVGIYCGTGGWIDLSSKLKSSGIPLSSFPAATNYYTQFGGKKCALPLLADDYGLYYNKDLFKAAGLSGPPKTIAQLHDVREEADEVQLRRVDQGPRLRSVHRLLREHP